MKTIVRIYFFFSQAFEIKSLPILHLFRLLPRILNPLRWQYITIPFTTPTIHCIWRINLAMKNNDFGTFRFYRRLKISHRNFLQAMIFVALTPALWPVAQFLLPIYIPRQISLQNTDYLTNFIKIFTEIR